MAWKGFQQKLNTFKNFRANLVLEWKLFLKDCIELWNQEIDRGEFMPCPCSDWSLCSEGNSMLHLDQAPHPAKCRDSLALHPTSFTYGNYRLIFDFSSWHPLSLCSFLKFVCLVWVFWERIPGSSGWSLNCHSNENDCEFLIVWPPPELWDFRHKPPPHLALGSTSNTAPFSLSLSLCLFVCLFVCLKPVWPFTCLDSWEDTSWQEQMCIGCCKPHTVLNTLEWRHNIVSIPQISGWRGTETSAFCVVPERGHACGSPRLASGIMSLFHLTQWCSLSVKPRAPGDGFSPYTACSADLLFLPSGAAMITWHFSGFWKSKSRSSSLHSHHLTTQPSPQPKEDRFLFCFLVFGFFVVLVWFGFSRQGFSV